MRARHAKIIVSAVALFAFPSAGVTRIPPTPVAQSTAPSVVLDSLTVPTEAVVGLSYTASAQVHVSGGTAVIQAIVVAVRSVPTGAEFDFPGTTSATIGDSCSYVYASGSRTFPAGSYQAFVAILMNDVWTNLPPASTFAVSASAPAVAVDSLTVPPITGPGVSVSASAHVHAINGDVAVQAITLAVRSVTSGAQYNFPAAVGATIPATGYVYTSGHRTFPAGTYDAFVAVEIEGVWTNLSPHRKFVVDPVTFSQDFNGSAGATANADLPTPVWFNDPCWANNPTCTGSLAEYREDHARQDGAGSLVLTADKRHTAGAQCVSSGACQYATARLTMLDWAGNSGIPSWSQTGGHIEARIKLPPGTGLWPAFWLVGNQSTGTWPQTGEIDVMENLGQQPANIAQFGHGGATDINIGGCYTLPAGTTIAQWHTYAVDWDASTTGYLKWSVDGVVTRTLTAAAANAARANSWSSFMGPEAIIIDLAVGGSAGPPNRSTSFPARMYIDYIRAYQYPMN